MSLGSIIKGFKPLSIKGWGQNTVFVPCKACFLRGGDKFVPRDIAKGREPLFIKDWEQNLVFVPYRACFLKGIINKEYADYQNIPIFLPMGLAIFDVLCYTFYSLNAKIRKEDFLWAI